MVRDGCVRYAFPTCCSQFYSLFISYSGKLGDRYTVKYAIATSNSSFIFSSLLFLAKQGTRYGEICVFYIHFFFLFCSLLADMLTGTQ